jgi:hypothetical protein
MKRHSRQRPPLFLDLVMDTNPRSPHELLQLARSVTETIRENCRGLSSSKEKFSLRPPMRSFPKVGKRSPYI